MMEDLCGENTIVHRNNYEAKPWHDGLEMLLVILFTSLLLLSKLLGKIDKQQNAHKFPLKKPVPVGLKTRNVFRFLP